MSRVIHDTKSNQYNVPPNNAKLSIITLSTMNYLFYFILFCKSPGFLVWVVCPLLDGVVFKQTKWTRLTLTPTLPCKD